MRSKKSVLSPLPKCPGEGYCRNLGVGIRKSGFYICQKFPIWRYVFQILDCGADGPIGEGVDRIAALLYRPYENVMVNKKAALYQELLNGLILQGIRDDDRPFLQRRVCISEIVLEKHRQEQFQVPFD